MNITRNVVLDLLPVYVSGEASADTSALVEEFLRADPALDRLVTQARKEDIMVETHGSLPVGHEKATLLEAKRLINRWTWLRSLALVFTLMPLSFAFGGRPGITWAMLRDNPSMAIAFWGAAAVCWVAFFAINARLRTTAGRMTRA